jgi:hypothetical protein
VEDGSTGSDGSEDDDQLPIVSSPRLPVRRKHAHPDVQGLLRLTSAVSWQFRGGLYLVAPWQPWLSQVDFFF